MSLWAELRRRNVVRVGIAYALIAWVVLQIVDFLVEVIDAPPWVLQVFVIAAGVGLLVVLIFAWVFEMTPEGIKRESEIDRSQSITPSTGHKLDRMIIVFLAVAVVFLLAERYWNMPEPTAEPNAMQSSAPAEPETAATQGNAVEKKSIAVLPFVAFSNGPDDEYFADGLTEEILNALAQLPELLVTARTSAFSFKGKDVPVQEIAAALGVDNVVEGSVRRSGDRLRVTAQLVRAQDGFHLWSETYDSTDEDAIQVQEDIAVQIARVLDVILDEARREAMRQAGLRNVEAFIAFQKGIRAYSEAHGSEHQVAALLEVNHYFDQVLALVPDYPPALISHADAYVHLITDAATGGDEGASGGMEPRAAFDQAVADYLAAAESARNFNERTGIEFDLATITGQFTGMRGRLEQAIGITGENCVSPVWIDQLAIVFGYARPMHQALQRVVACDPLQVNERFALARALLWDGDAPAALKEIQRVRDEGLSHPWIDLLEVQSNIVLGRFESASGMTALQQRSNGLQFFSGSILAAAQGDRQRSDEMFRKGVEDESGDGFLSVAHYAHVGDREAANRLAAQIDERALSPLVLVSITAWCACGAPFDLEATPRFSAKLAEDSLPWPPPRVIDYPLKDW
jgi:TolB-like protein